MRNMAKYYKFNYSAGYCGTDEEAVFKFPDDVSEDEVKEVFEDWYNSVNTASGNFDEISEEEAEEDGIDMDCTEDMEDESIV